MSDEEMEASISLLHMMHPTDIPIGYETMTGNRDALHDSLMKVVANQASDKLPLPQIAAQKKVHQRGIRITAISRELTLDHLRPHFGRPIVEVARQLGICTTFLKKICRRCGIKRWPHRQIRSLNRTIKMLEQVGSLATDPLDKARYAAQINELKEKQRAVMEDPDANVKLKRVKRYSISKGAIDFAPMADRQNSGSLPQPLAVPPPENSSTTNCSSATRLSALAVAVDIVSSGLTSQTNVIKQRSASWGSFVLDVQILSSASPTPSSLTTPSHAAEPNQKPFELKISPSNRKIVLARES